MASNKHIELVEAVNNSKTIEEHKKAKIYLQVFRAGVSNCDYYLDLCGCDMYYIDKGIDRPMCGGVWLDWKPSDSPSTTTVGGK